MSAEMPKACITLIGCGKMGSALLRGWVDHNLLESALVVDPTRVSGVFDESDPVEYMPNPPNDYGQGKDILIIAVKPQILRDVGMKIVGKMPHDMPVLSIAAGQTLNALEVIFGPERPIIRAMPNTPAAIGKGMSVCIPNSKITKGHKELADKLLKTCGKVEWIKDEALMDAVTALSGSGPAYVFYLIEILEKAGIEIGLKPEMAKTLARQTVIGSAALAESDAHIPASTLRENVTSPGGTTEAALKILMDGRLQDLLNEALSAAKKRSEELNA